ncbi:ABC-type branched-chain amino acid transport system, permease component [Cenarchaeum symbiosum A]|uniref:ABC-type branched-chain amino acid transport system, permease component n=1 Tax=Cenarchaeum symbiosum (strain A) TaxID=414004 RepID=A0RWY1_CENSY|nr:ABC-type branched-chain amino acid transport system, permease component [Cenarchaeum symbiosum A]
MAYDILALDAIIYACILAVLCTGLTLTYKITRVPNFAHMSFAILGMYVVLVVTKIAGLGPYYSLPLSFAASGALALVLYYGVIKTLQKKGASYLTIMIATLSFDFVMIGILNIIADVISEYRITSREFTLRSFDGELFGAPAVLTVSLAIMAGLVVGLYYLLYRTKFGVSMRAAIENRSLAETVGINTNMMFGFSWFLSGGLAGLAGVLLALWFQGDPSLAAIMIPSVFAGSIVGGFTSIYGAILGGVLIGVSEIFGTGLLASATGAWVVAYRPVVAFIFIVVTLLVLPNGLASLRRRA